MADGIARAVGQQAGKVVEGGVKKAMNAYAQKGQKGGQEGEKKKEGGGGGGGLNIDDVLSFDGGNKNEGQGGGGGGGGLGNVVGGLFK
ncbi:calpain clp-1-like isoform X2 [Oreochromis niloticus]|uniref:calpain clp-1-like isoform X2 n=1 Tax=Oreochromis niloticus TaxID=8128 RepID=UPI000393D7FD|nr:calpain clp-1-like isoform X2 [Oreochromis niloticus]